MAMPAIKPHHVNLSRAFTLGASGRRRHIAVELALLTEAWHMDKIDSSRTSGTKFQASEANGSLLSEASGQILSAVNPACGIQNQSSPPMQEKHERPPVNPACGINQVSTTVRLPGR
jgi:hypothetical protein